MNTKIVLRDKIFSDVGNKTAIITPGKMGLDNDGRLIELGKGIGLLAQALFNPLERRNQLQRLAAYAVGWATVLGARNVFQLVHVERERQQKLLKAGKFSFTCSSPAASPPQKYRVLFEEVGEVAKEVDLLANAITGEICQEVIACLITELVQVAAVCVAWLEGEVTP
jgi:hypothetical protein